MSEGESVLRAMEVRQDWTGKQLRAMEVRQAWVDKPQLGELLSLQQLDSWHRCCKVFETEQMRSLLCEVFETELQLDHKVSQLRINVV